MGRGLCAAAASCQPPLLIAADQEGGTLLALTGTTPFPGNLALGAAGSASLTRQTGYAIGRELAAMGINVNYAPVCDVNVNPQNPVVGPRSFGEDPARVAELSAAMVEGLQAAGVAATPKHFPGYGDPAMEALAAALWGERPFRGRLPVSIPGMYPLGHGIEVDA